jgi:hypothetical protein
MVRLSPVRALLLLLCGLLLRLPTLALAQKTLINGSRIISGSFNYCDASGGPTAYTCTFVPGIGAYNAGTRYTFKAPLANTGAATLNLNSLGAIPIKKLIGGATIALAANDIRAGQIVDVMYDGTNMQMLSQTGVLTNLPTPVNATDAATKNYVDTNVPSGSGTVTSVATTAPITGGTFTVSGTIGCATCTTNASALTSGLPMIGGGSQAAAVGTKTGNTTVFVTQSGAATSGRCAQYDASGNLTATGAACGTATGLGDPGADGIVVRSGAGTSVARTLTGTANQVIVTNGTGVAGNPTLTTPQDIATSSKPTFAGANLTAFNVWTAVTAPATPAPSFGNVYVDSTSKNLAVKDDAGLVKHGVQTQAAVANNFVTAINDAGAVTVAQPSAATLSNGTTGSGAVVLATLPTLTIFDANFTLQDNADATKQAQFQLSSLTTGTTRTYTWPDVSDTVVLVGATQTLTNKTLTSPVLTTPTIASFTNATHTHQAAASGGTLAEAALVLTDITTNNASTSAHGFMQKYPGGTTTFLRADGTFATPSGGGNVSTSGTPVSGQLAQWTSATAIQGSTALTTDATTVLTRKDKVTAVSVDTTLGAHNIVYCTAGATNKTMTLPAGSSTTVGFYRVIKADTGAGACVVMPNGSDLLNGINGSKAATVQFAAVEATLVSPTNWHVITDTPAANYRTCMMILGADNGTALVNADLGPQLHQCRADVNMTVTEIAVYADAGTPNVIVHKRTGTTNTALLTGALATAASGAIACAKTTAVTGLDGATTCSATLQNASIPAGYTVGLTSGTAGGTAKRVTVAVTMTVD